MGGPLENWIRFWTLFKRETYRYVSRWGQTIFPPVISTVLFIVIFGFVLGSRMRLIEGHEYILFIFPGLLLMGAGNSAFHNASFSLFISRWDHFVEDLLVSPLSYLQMVMAFLLASTVRGLVTGLVILASGSLLLGSPFAHPAHLFLALLMSSLLFSAFGIIVGLWADDWDQLALFQNFIMTPLMFLGGVFYSTSNLPDGFRWVNEANPIYYMVSAIRHSILGSADTSFWVGMLPTTFFTVVFAVLAVRLFRTGYKLRT